MKPQDRLMASVRTTAARKKAVHDPAELEKLAVLRIKERQGRGVDLYWAGWQSTMELMLANPQSNSSAKRGKVCPLFKLTPKSTSMFLKVTRALDLPPSVNGIFVAKEVMAGLQGDGANLLSTIMAQYNSDYEVVLGCRDLQTVIHLTMPRIAPAIIEVYKGRNLTGQFKHYSTRVALEDLNRLVWECFGPSHMTKTEVVTYTDNWHFRTFSSGAELGELPVHAGFSYLHHPELIGATAMEAAMKVLKTSMSRRSLDEAVEAANDINQCYELSGAKTVISAQEIKNGSPVQCKAMFDAVMFDMYLHMDTLCVFLKDLNWADRLNDPLTMGIFIHAAREIFRKTTGMTCPAGVASHNELPVGAVEEA